MNDILGLGKIPCQRCGRPHDLRPSTDHYGVITWADPDDEVRTWDLTFQCTLTAEERADADAFAEIILYLLAAAADLTPDGDPVWAYAGATLDDDDEVGE